MKVKNQPFSLIMELRKLILFLIISKFLLVSQPSNEEIFSRRILFFKFYPVLEKNAYISLKNGVANIRKLKNASLPYYGQCCHWVAANWLHNPTL